MRTNKICTPYCPEGVKFQDNPTSSDGKPVKPDAEPNPEDVEAQIAALKKDNSKLYNTLYGKGVVTGRQEVTQAHLDRVIDTDRIRLLEQLSADRITAKIKVIAEKAGFFDPSDAVDGIGNRVKLNRDLKVVTTDEEGHEIEADLDGMVKEIASKKPHLIRSTQTPGQGSTPPAPRPGNGGRDDSKPIFKRSQLRDSSFYQKNEAAITEAVREGRIVDDIGDIVT